MKKLYTLLIVAFMVLPNIGLTNAQVVQDSAKMVMLRVKSTKPDINWSGKTTALCDDENDLIVQVSIDSFNLSAYQIDSAVLRIFFKTPSTAGDFAFYEMDPNWVDTIVTWNSAAELTVADTTFATLTVDQAVDTNYWVNITDFIKLKLDAGEDFGWRIISVDGTASATSRTSYHADAIMQPTIFITSKDLTGIPDQKGVNISVFPNPATDHLKILLEERREGTVSLYNTVGAQVLKKQFHSDNIQLALEGIRAGMYFLTIESGQSIIHTKKIIVR